jgi:Lrp/AsnC family transcriptional regulator, leucine-responsive regulatory protein
VTLHSERELDDTSWKLLMLLQEDARLSFTELGRRVNLSTPAVTERVRKLEEAGVIAAYRAEVNPASVGRPIMAFVQFIVPKRDEAHAVELIKSLPEIVECHHVAGNVSMMLKLYVPTVQRLEQIIKLIGKFGETQTMIVLSSPLPGRAIEMVSGE